MFQEYNYSEILLYIISKENRIYILFDNFLRKAAGSFGVLLPKRIEYILEGNSENLSVWIFSVPFSLKGSSKCTNHVNVHKLYAVEYINTVCSLDYPFQFRIF